MFNPCKTSIKTTENSSKHVILYVIFFILRYAAVFIFLFPRFEIAYCCASAVLFIISGILFVIVSCKDPGYLLQTDNLLDLYEKYIPDYICPYCRVKKIKSTIHCQYCKRCVKVSQYIGF